MHRHYWFWLEILRCSVKQVLLRFLWNMEVHYDQGFVDSFYSDLRVLEMTIGSLESLFWEPRKLFWHLWDFLGLLNQAGGFSILSLFIWFSVIMGFYWFCLPTDNRRIPVLSRKCKVVSQFVLKCLSGLSRLLCGVGI